MGYATLDPNILRCGPLPRTGFAKQDPPLESTPRIPLADPAPPQETSGSPGLPIIRRDPAIVAQLYAEISDPVRDYYFIPGEPLEKQPGYQPLIHETNKGTRSVAARNYCEWQTHEFEVESHRKAHDANLKHRPVDPDEIDVAVSGLHHAMVSSLDKRKEAILRILAGRTSQEMAAIRKRYEEEYERMNEEEKAKLPRKKADNAATKNESIFDIQIKAALGGDKLATQEADGYLNGNQLQAAKAAIDKATIGNATGGLVLTKSNKQEIFAALERLTSDELKELQVNSPILATLNQRLDGDEKELALALLAADHGRTAALKLHIASEKNDKPGMLAVLRRAAQDKKDYQGKQDTTEHDDLLMQYSQLGEDHGKGVEHYAPQKNSHEVRERATTAENRSERDHMHWGAKALERVIYEKLSGSEAEEARALIGPEIPDPESKQYTPDKNHPYVPNLDAAAQAAEAEANSSWTNKEQKVLEAKEQYGKLNADEQATLAAIRIHNAIHWFETADHNEIFAALRTVTNPALRGKIKKAYQEQYGKSLDDVLKDKLESYDAQVAHRILGDTPR